MNTNRLLTLSALLLATACGAHAADGEYQPYGDSTGGSSAAAGHLLSAPSHATPALAGTAAARQHLAAVRADVEGGVATHADSTGDTSRLHGDLLWQEAHAAATPRALAQADTPSGAEYQPYGDSTGGSSQAHGELAPTASITAIAQPSRAAHVAQARTQP